MLNHFVFKIKNILANTLDKKYVHNLGAYKNFIEDNNILSSPIINESFIKFMRDCFLFQNMFLYRCIF